jgi:hypothetical protein
VELCLAARPSPPAFKRMNARGQGQRLDNL